MYKKIIFHKTSTDDVQTLNDRIRSEISSFLQLNGWTLTAKGNSYNIVLSKDYSGQDAVSQEEPEFASLHGSYNANYSNTLISISRHSTNGRILTMLNGENPKTRSAYTNATTSLSYPPGYNDTYDNYGQYGDFSSTGYGSYFPSMSVRLDDLIEEASLEMFYFTDSDTQEEFYIVIKTDRVFGRVAPTDSQFYQTLAFAKIPGIPMLSTCTMQENNALQGRSSTRIIKDVFQIKTASNGVKYIPEWTACEQYSNQTWIGQGCNMASETSVINPRFDAPDSTDNLWLHIACFRCLNGESLFDNKLDYQEKSWNLLKYPWGLWQVCFLCNYRETLNGVDVWQFRKTLGYFNSYEFLHQQGVSSEFGGSVLCPVARLYKKGRKHEIRHSKRYNVYHTKPESVVLSDTYKCYPTLRRSLMGYSSLTQMNLSDPRIIHNPTNTSETVQINNVGNGSKGNSSWATKGWFFTEEYQDGGSQPVLKSAWAGEEIDASGYEGFALDYTDYDVNNVSEVDLRSNP